MLSSLQSKTRREYITKLYEVLNSVVPAYLGASVHNVPGDNKFKIIKVHKESFDLKRYLKVQHQTHYLYDREHQKVTKLNNIAIESPTGLLLA